MGKGDIESGFSHGSDGLYPYMIESPELRWGFIRKVYIIISVQLLFTAAFSSIFIFFTPARNFARYNNYAPFLFFGAAIFSIICTYLSSLLVYITFSFPSETIHVRFKTCFLYVHAVLFVLSKYYNKHPVNLILLGLYTLGMSVAVGYACAFVDGILSELLPPIMYHHKDTKTLK